MVEYCALDVEEKKIRYSYSLVTSKYGSESEWRVMYSTVVTSEQQNLWGAVIHRDKKWTNLFSAHQSRQPVMVA